MWSGIVFDDNLCGVVSIFAWSLDMSLPHTISKHTVLIDDWGYIAENCSVEQTIVVWRSNKQLNLLVWPLR
jgi:hypothetical protein